MLMQMMMAKAVTECSGIIDTNMHMAFQAQLSLD